MTFHCDVCNEERSFETEYSIAIATDKVLRRICKLCRRPKAGAPDVFWDGKPEENLADDPLTGKPRVFGSRGEKAAYLAANGLREAGDRVHGAPLSTAGKRNKSDSRHEVMMALKKVKEMGIDNRRQEFYRIKKEGERRVYGGH